MGRGAGSLPLNEQGQRRRVLVNEVAFGQFAISTLRRDGDITNKGGSSVGNGLRRRCWSSVWNLAQWTRDENCGRLQ